MNEVLKIHVALAHRHVESGAPSEISDREKRNAGFQTTTGPQQIFQSLKRAQTVSKLINQNLNSFLKPRESRTEIPRSSAKHL